MGITGTQTKRNGLAVPALTGALWVLSGVGYAVLTQFSTHPSASVAALILPQTVKLDFATAGGASAALPGQWTAAILAGCLTAVLTAVLLPAGRGRQVPGAQLFLSAWMAVTLASAAGTTVLGMGGLLMDWPPLRLATSVETFFSAPTAGARWGLFWGWFPALLALLQGAGGRGTGRRAADREHPVRLPLAIATLAGALLLSAVPSPVIPPTGQDARTGPDPAPFPEPPPTEEPAPEGEQVVYGAELTGPVIDPPDPGRCSGEEVRIGADGWDAALGSRGARLTLEVTGNRSCTVRGYPDLDFNRTDGWVMDITAVHGGSMMTTDTPGGELTLAPGQMATAQIGWRGTSGAGMSRIGTLLVAPYSGTLRQPLEVDMDLTEPGFLTVTSWIAADAGSPPPGAAPAD